MKEMRPERLLVDKQRKKPTNGNAKSKITQKTAVCKYLRNN